MTMIPEPEYSKVLYPLPTWLAERVPDSMREVRYVRHDEATGNYFVDGDEQVTYDTLIDAYDSHDRKTEEYEMDISPEALTAAGVDPEDPIIVIGSRLLPIFLDSDRMDLLQHDWDQSIMSVLLWRENKDNFPCAYRMLNNHPVFWIRYGRDEEKTYSWSDGGSVLAFWHTLTDEGMMVMKAGEHDINNDYRSLVDPWMVVEGKTFSECIIKMAHLVDENFNEDGTPRS